eukprot:TRINITY_DN3080_c0_g1_i1.p2 TRINITY_DN3080_c0_g1~~TRINITY_DN3080_c0_g1_i1.p2  ORF type:complete len:1289 (-),score=401.81 TRINITY_DN3080_c0_g1_i1:8548-12327(-)
MAEWNEAGKVDHKANMTRKLVAEREALRFELTMKERSTQQRVATNTIAAHGFQEDVHRFESTLAQRTQKKSDAVATSAVPALSATAAFDEARRERERRRRKLMVEQQAAAEQAERARDEERMLTALMRASRDEARLAEEYAQRQRVKEDMKRRRIVRDQQYALRRDQDFAEHLRREAEIARRERADAEELLALERQRYKELHDAQRAEKYRQRYEWCQNDVHQLVDLAMKSVACKEAGDAEPGSTSAIGVSPAEFRSWVALFVAGIPQFPAAQPQGDADSDGETGDWLDEADSLDYLRAQGEWALAGETQSAVGPCVAHLRKVVHPAPPAPPLPDIPQVPVSIAVLGASLSGKSSVATQLANSRRLALLSVDTLLDAAVQTEAGSGDDELVSLGETARNAASTGAPVPDEILVRLVVRAIRAVDRHEYPGGWVLDGFPRTKAQAAALEKALTGYEPPPPPPEPKKGQRTKAAVAPVPTEPAGPPPVSGIDAVVRLDVPKERLEERAVESQALQLQPSLLAYEQAVPELQEWFARFQNLKPVDAFTELDSVVVSATMLLDEVATKKKLDADEKAAAAEAASVAAASATVAAEQASLADKTEAELKIIADEKAAAEAKAAADAEAKVKYAQYERELAEKLLEQWETAENRYANGMRTTFRALRRARRSLLRYIVRTRGDFKTFLAKPSDRDERLITFIKSFNTNMVSSLRATDDGKAELHLRVDEFRDTLWNMADKNKEEAEAERQAVIADGFVQHVTSTLQDLFCRLLQLEVDRHVFAKQFVADFFAWRSGRPLKEEPITTVSIIGEEDEPAPTGKGARAKTPSKPASTAGKPAAGAKPPAKGAKKGAVDETAAAPDPIAIAIAKVKEVLMPETAPAAAAVPAAAAPAEGQPPIDPALVAAEQESLTAEDELFRSRVAAIDARAHAAVAAPADRTQELYGAMERWLTERFRADVQGVRSAVHVFKTAITDGEVVRSTLRLEPNIAVVDEGLLIVAPDAPPPIPDPVEQRFSDKFTVHQLRGVFTGLKRLCPDGFIHKNELTVLLVRLAASTAETQILPDVWATRDAAQMQATAAAFDIGTGHVDWRVFMTELAVPVPPSNEQLLQLRDALLARGQGDFVDRDAFVSTRFFFDEPVPAGVFDRWTVLKELLFEVFCNEQDTVSITLLLLYLASTTDATAGLQRAWSALGASLSAEAVFTVLHRSLPSPQTPLPYVASADAASQAVINSIFGAATAMSFVEFSRSSEGSRLVKACNVYARRI